MIGQKSESALKVETKLIRSDEYRTTKIWVYRELIYFINREIPKESTYLSIY